MLNNTIDIILFSIVFCLIIPVLCISSADRIYGIVENYKIKRSPIYEKAKNFENHLRQYATTRLNLSEIDFISVELRIPEVKWNYLYFFSNGVICYDFHRSSSVSNNTLWLCKNYPHFIEPLVQHTNDIEKGIIIGIQKQMDYIKQNKHH